MSATSSIDRNFEVELLSSALVSGDMDCDTDVPSTAKGDCDGDGDHDFDDIPGFLAILRGGPISGGLQSVPEPSSILLTAVALMGLRIRYRWRQRSRTR